MVMRYQSLYRSFIIACLVGLTACSSGSDTAFNDKSGYYDSRTPKVEKQKVGRPYQISGQWYTPAVDETYDEIGIASWYGPGFDGRPAANGEIFNENKISAAHKTLPLPSYVQVTNLDNGKQLYVRINDRGPFVDDRIIDLSKKAAELLGSKNTGVARVRVRVAPPPYNVTLLTPDGKTIVGTHRQSPRKNTMIANKQPAQDPIETASIKQTHLPLYQGVSDNEPSRATGNNIPKYANNTPPSPLPPLNDTYAVKIGVFSDTNNISNLQRNISSLGTVQVKPIYRNGQMLSQVSLEGYKTHQEALNTVDALNQLGINDAIIINKD
jgi:rare lipoprotein A